MGGGFRIGFSRYEKYGKEGWDNKLLGAGNYLNPQFLMEKLSVLLSCGKVKRQRNMLEIYKRFWKDGMNTIVPNG
jgi:hypothetical protein